MDAFDADVLIYAAAPEHTLGRRVAALFPVNPMGPDDPPVGLGSMLLLPELLSKPTRDEADDEVAALAGLLGRLELHAVDAAIGRLAVAFGAAYRLAAADAVHLATAVQAGADRFITNNARDFPKTISEVDITYPTDLDDPDSSDSG
ncbi:MAG: type II toxin-antitoxin system VapC family toxin [Gaiellales bacterium]